MTRQNFLVVTVILLIVTVDQLLDLALMVFA